MPGTLRTFPSKLSSPTKSLFSMNSHATCPVATRIPSAIGKSKAQPLFLMSEGAKLTTIFLLGIAKPEVLIAVLTRSRASCTAVSAIPTIAIPGSELMSDTSTHTGVASTPRRTALLTQTGVVILSHPKRVNVMFYCTAVSVQFHNIHNIKAHWEVGKIMTYKIC